MDRENFYKLFTKVLSLIEDERYVCVISRDNKASYKDINYALVTIYDSYNVTTSMKDISFTENVVRSKYYDFTYYQSEKEEFNTEVISLEEIKKILLQHIIEFPYLLFLYTLIVDKYNELKDNIYSSSLNIIYLNDPVKLVLSDEEIEDIVSIMGKYYKEEKNIKTRLRKKEF